MAEKPYTGLSNLPDVQDTRHFAELAEVYGAISLLVDNINAIMYGAAADTLEENLQRHTLQNFFAVRLKVTSSLPAGAIVSLQGSGGEVVAISANSTTLSYTGAFLTEAVTANNRARVCLFGLVSGYTGLSPGRLYNYTSSTNYAISDNVYGQVIALTPTQVCMLGRNL